MVVFALLAHGGPVAMVAAGICLFVVAAIIGRSLGQAPRPAALLGLAGPTAHLVSLTLVGVALAVAAGVLHRGQPGVLPGATRGWHLFVLLAAVIGVAEELLYRGWMMTRLAPLGWPAAVVLAALAHAGYKTALFVWPPDTVIVSYDLWSMLLWTAVGGTLLGVLRASSRSVVPAAIAHAAFDLVVYSSFAAPPWWVWG